MENIIYYLFLFFLVIIIRFFKLKNDYKNDFNEKWREVFYSSLEIVYTASGVVIALLLNVTKHWIASVVIVYLVIVIFSALLEMSNENFGNKTKTILHSVIILIVLFSTIITYVEVLPKVDINGSPLKNVDKTISNKKDYTILIPYYDNSLIRHIGNKKIKENPFIFECNVITNSKDSVYFLAKKKIAKNNLISKMFPSNLNDIEIVEDKIIIFETRKIKDFALF